MVPLNSVCKDDAWFEPCNSPLAETSVLGFEYGHTLGADDRLVVWEAQFGDFANVAQPIIDLFLASGEARWMNSSRLVVCLPHGMDGNGPVSLQLWFLLIGFWRCCVLLFLRCCIIVILTLLLRRSSAGPSRCGSSFIPN